MFLQKHPFHLTEISVWPVVSSFIVFFLTSSTVLYFHHFQGSFYVLITSLVLLSCAIICWTNDVSKEADYVGDHTKLVVKGLSIGFTLFIVTEIWFFIGIFWGYFHSSLNPSVELGAIWPPAFIEPINAYELPLLNTVILLSSGGTLTFAHHKLISGERVGVINGMILTIFLGFIFLICQFIEYKTASFTIVDSVYGNCFYLTTGFHGFHVIIGGLFLVICLFRMYNYKITGTHHVGLNSGILYWHLVDVVWLFVLTFLYFWGS